MADIATSMTAVFDQAWERFVTRLEGLDDDEYLWEPVPGCWTVRPGEGGREGGTGGREGGTGEREGGTGEGWRIDGDGGDGGPAGAPVPAPITTIAWRVGHIGLSLIGFADRLFGDGRITLADVRIAPTVTDALDFLTAAYRGWRDGMVAVPPDRWWSPIGPAFGGYAELSTTDLCLHVLDEQVHHAAEVGLLRDLYLRRDVLGR